MRGYSDRTGMGGWQSIWIPWAEGLVLLLCLDKRVVYSVRVACCTYFASIVHVVLVWVSALIPLGFLFVLNLNRDAAPPIDLLEHLVPFYSQPFCSWIWLVLKGVFVSIFVTSHWDCTHFYMSRPACNGFSFAPNVTEFIVGCHFYQKIYIKWRMGS